MNKVLIVEDDLDINNLIKETLEKHNYICTQAFSGTEGMMHTKIDSFDLIVLDLMLPGLTGEAFIEDLRGLNTTPVLVVSAKDSIDSKIECLNLGADDYLIKPFDIKELKARADALIRRTKKNSDKPAESENINYKGLILDKDLFDIRANDKFLNLTRQEYKVMKLLLENPNKVFTKQEIYEYAWEEYYIGDDKTINVHISNIRKKIREFINEEVIETVWGIGFKLKK